MQDISNKFSEVKILIYGDLMLDQYWWGSVERISPEAPVPVVSFDRKTLVAGGAANVAANIIGLGATPYVVGVTGNDSSAGDLENLLEGIGISTDHLIRSESRPTTVKTRIIASNQQIVRLDREEREDLAQDLEARVSHDVDQLIDLVDVVIISDYAKGSVTGRLSRHIIKKATDAGISVLVDPKGKDYTKYKGAGILTPNQKEALDASGIDYADDETLKEVGQKLLRDFELENLLITRGEKGMALFGLGTEMEHLNTVARKVYDVTGAGDTVIAALSVALGAGAGFSQSCKFANDAAGIVVERVGTTAINKSDLNRLVAKK